MEVPECSICYEGLDESTRRPRSLPCGHTICKMCIDMSIERGDRTCPCCRQPHHVTSASKLPVNYALEEIFQKLSVNSSGTSRANEGDGTVKKNDSSDDGREKKKDIISETKYVKNVIEATILEMQKEMIMKERLIDYQQDQLKQKLAEAERLRKDIQDEDKVKQAIGGITIELEEKRRFLENTVQKIQISKDNADICTLYEDVTRTLTMKDFQLSEEYCQTRVEKVVKASNGLGFTILGDPLITGAVDFDACMFVNRIIPGSAAHRQGGLKTGDHLISVNGVAFEGHSYISISQLIGGMTGEIAIEVRYKPVAYMQIREKCRSLFNRDIFLDAFPYCE